MRILSTIPLAFAALCAGFFLPAPAAAACQTFGGVELCDVVVRATPPRRVLHWGTSPLQIQLSGQVSDPQRYLIMVTAYVPGGASAARVGVLQKEVSFGRFSFADSLQVRRSTSPRAEVTETRVRVCRVGAPCNAGGSGIVGEMTVPGHYFFGDWGPTVELLRGSVPRGACVTPQDAVTFDVRYLTHRNGVIQAQGIRPDGRILVGAGLGPADTFITFGERTATGIDVALGRRSQSVSQIEFVLTDARGINYFRHRENYPLTIVTNRADCP